ncbi:MAG: AAA family ATPase [Chloroflexi bacterium]|nr:AAA family ATPase [Chloroflexota bacterium]
MRSLIEEGGEMERGVYEELPHPWNAVAGYQSMKNRELLTLEERLEAFEFFIEPLADERAIYEAVFPEPPEVRALPGLVSAAELRHGQYTPTQWAIPNLLPAGLGVLAGKAKVGKSWLALQMAKAVAKGSQLFEDKVQKGRVLYLALEDPRGRIKARTHKQGWANQLEVQFLTMDEANQIEDMRGEGMEQLKTEIRRGRYRLVVIDTLSQAFGGGQMSLAQMMRTMKPLHNVANKRNCTVLLVDHHRKSSMFTRDTVNDLYGSIGKSGVADTILGLYRTRGRVGARLEVRGRDVAERTMALYFESKRGMWHYEGEAGEKLSEERGAIVTYLKEAGPKTAKVMAREMGVDYGNLHRKLQAMVEDGVLERGKNQDGICYAVERIA